MLWNNYITNLLFYYYLQRNVGNGPGERVGNGEDIAPDMEEDTEEMEDEEDQLYKITTHKLFFLIFVFFKYINVKIS